MKIKTTYDPSYCIKETNDFLLDNGNQLLTEYGNALIEHGYFHGYYDAIHEMNEEDREKLYYM